MFFAIKEAEIIQLVQIYMQFEPSIFEYATGKTIHAIKDHSDGFYFISNNCSLIPVM